MCEAGVEGLDGGHALVGRGLLRGVGGGEGVGLAALGALGRALLGLCRRLRLLWDQGWFSVRHNY